MTANAAVAVKRRPTTGELFRDNAARLSDEQAGVMFEVLRDARAVEMERMRGAGEHRTPTAAERVDALRAFFGGRF